MTQRPGFAVDTWLPAGTLELCVRDKSVARVSLDASLRGGQLREACDAAARQLSRSLSLHAAELLTLDDVEHWLDETAEHSPAAVRALVPRLFSMVELAEVLRALLREGVPVRDLGLVLEAIAEERRSAQVAADPGHMAEVARRALKSTLSRAVADESGAVHVVRLDALLEDTVREALHTSGGRTSCHLAPGAARDVVAAVRRALSTSEGVAAEPAAAPVLLTSQGVRRFVRELIAVELPELRVVCAEELLPQLRVQLVGTATPYELEAGPPRLAM
jgi:flagellar biosynthesis component FlhA